MSSRLFRFPAALLILMSIFTLFNQTILTGQPVLTQCEFHTGWTNFSGDKILFPLGWHYAGTSIDVEFSGQSPDHDIAIFAMGRGFDEPANLFKVASSASVGSEESLLIVTHNFESGFAHQYYLRVVSVWQPGTPSEPEEKRFEFSVCFE